MNVKTIMKHPFAACFILVIYLNVVLGDIKDFIIASEDDLKYIDHGDEIDQLDYDNDVGMYDACHGGGNHYGDIQQGDVDFDQYGADILRNFMQGSEMNIQKLHELVQQMAQDPRYAAIMAQAAANENVIPASSCASDSYVDVPTEAHNDGDMCVI